MIAQRITVWNPARRIFARAWWWLRQVSGDAAYENYLSRAARPHATREHAAPLSAGAFYLDQLRRRYSRPNRCC